MSLAMYYTSFSSSRLCYNYIFSSMPNFSNSSFINSLSSSSSKISTSVMGILYSCSHTLIIFSMVCSSTLYLHGNHSWTRSLHTFKYMWCMETLNCITYLNLWITPFVRNNTFFTTKCISSNQTKHTTFLEIFSSFFAICQRLLYLGMMNSEFGGYGNWTWFFCGISQDSNTIRIHN